jgi:LysM repeat protein
MRKVVLSFVLSVFAALALIGQADSLGIKKEGEQFFVIHKVIAGQTLYSLSRRYGASVSDIKNKNAELASGLQVGQTILIPYSRPIPASQPSAGKTHVVKTGETLFSISKQYNLDVLDLKRLNGLNTNELSIGQTLKIALSTNTPSVIKEEKSTEKKPTEVVKKETDVIKEKATVNKASDTEKGVQQKAQNQIKTEDAKVEENSKSYSGDPLEHKPEEGLAELIVEDESSTKFLALHKTAKVGTVIKVKNLMNNLTVYVRVVGEIPKTTDNDKIIIKINKRAYDQLKALDTRFLVELSYFK